MSTENQLVGGTIRLLDNVSLVVEVAHVTMVVHRIEDVGSTVWAGILHLLVD